MPSTNKVLGQVSPSGATLTTLYTVPSGAQAVCSTLTICNTTATGVAYRLAVRPTGESIATKHYIAYDSSVGANDSVLLTFGLTLGQTDVVSVYAGAINLSFSLFGTEIT